MTDTEVNEAVARKLGAEESKSTLWKSLIKPYSTSIEAAWEIVEKYPLINKSDFDYNFLLSYSPEGWTARWFRYCDNLVCATADTAPRAICLAFLKL